MNKKIKKTILTMLIMVISATSLTGCGGGSKEEEKEEPEKVSTKEQRMVGHKYDFVDFINLGIKGANGVAAVKVLETKKIKSSDFKKESDFVRMKQIFADAQLDADKKENLKNGDRIKISFKSQIELTKKDAELLNSNDFVYEIKDLKEGTAIDLKSDIDFKVYSFESIADATTKKEKNNNYTMMFAAVPELNNKKVSLNNLNALLTNASVDDKVAKYGESIVSLKTGYDKEYIIQNNLMLSQLKIDTGLEPCAESLGGYITCSSTKDSILKSADIAPVPNFNFVDKEILKKSVLAYVNARFTSIAKESIKLSSDDLDFTAFDNVVSVYKYNDLNEKNGSYNEHSELNKYRYAVILSAKNKENKTVYVALTLGMLQNGDYIGLFNVDSQYMNLIMIQAGFSKEQAITPSENTQYSLSLATVL